MTGRGLGETERDKGYEMAGSHDGEPHGQERDEPQRQMAPPDGQGQREQGPAGELERAGGRGGGNLDDSEGDRKEGDGKETPKVRHTGGPPLPYPTIPAGQATWRREAEVMRPMGFLRQPGNLSV